VSPQPAVGTVISLRDVALAELLGTSLDVAWIDLEHGALTAADVPALAIALRAAGCRAEVRVPSWESEALAPVLDAGVDGVVVPAVEDAHAARELVRRLAYPPDGVRGYGPRRAAGYGRAAGRAPRPTCTIQIETAAGVDAAAAIAAIDGVDALVVGCADLGIALGGAPGEPTAKLTAAVGRVRAAARAAGRRFGIAGAAGAAALAELALGDADLVVHSVDVRLYARAADHAAAAAREAAA